MKISALTAATTPLSGAELFPVVQSGNTRRVSLNDLLRSIGNGTVSAPALAASADTNTGIYFPAADTIGFVEGGVEAMRLDASGNLGIGTTGPVRRLHVGNIAAGQGVRTSGPSSDNNWAGGIEFFSHDTTSLRFALLASSAGMRFFSGSTEFWRFDASGHFLAGADATYDIGASGANRPRNIYTGSDAFLAGVRVGLGGGAVNTNTAVGTNAIPGTATGGNNTAIGSESLFNLTGGTGNTAVGRTAMRGAGTGITAAAADNTAIGFGAMTSLSTGAQNVAVGANAMLTNTTGERNVAVGFNALRAGTTAAYSVAVGRNALQAATTAIENVAVGYDSLAALTTGNNNIAIGSLASTTMTAATETVAVGFNALRFATGSYNTGIGSAALRNSTSQECTAIGYAALRDTTTGAFNTAIGSLAGYLITTGANNTLLGRYNGNQDGLDLRTANNNIVLSDGDGNARLYYDGASNFWAFRNGGTERVRVKSGGQVRFVPLAAAPTTNVEDGDVYYDSGTNKLRVRAAGAWVDLH